MAILLQATDQPEVRRIFQVTLLVGEGAFLQQPEKEVSDVGASVFQTDSRAGLRHSLVHTGDARLLGTDIHNTRGSYTRAKHPGHVILHQETALESHAVQQQASQFLRVGSVEDVRDHEHRLVIGQVPGRRR